MADHLQRAGKIMLRVNELAAVTEDPATITRTYGTPAFVRGRALIETWMKNAGLQTMIDNIGNVRGKLISNHIDAKTFVIGSHIDTVVNAGKFDGPLGVIMAIDLAENLRHAKTDLPFNIEVIGFCDEEGVRFGSTFLGSKAVAGSFDNNILQKTDSENCSLKTAIENIGGNAVHIKDDAIGRKEWLGYFEIHIEQGPVLFEKNIPVAIVSAIAGQSRIQLEFTGFAGHAGTVPMNMRQDALTAAAEFIASVEQYAADRQDKIVATVGKLDIQNAASNVIPGKVNCTLDIRSAHEDVLAEAIDAIKEKTEKICSLRNIRLDWNMILQTKPVFCDEQLNSLLQQSVAEAGYEVIELVSGAGHDAVPISEVAPVSMLFIKCFKGISHNPMENTEVTDIAAALEVSDIYLDLIISTNNKK